MRTAIFIDGSWLYASMPTLIQSYGRNYQMDYGKLPTTLASQIARGSGKTDIDVIRTCLFGSYASNVDPADNHVALRRTGFFEMLRQEFHYEVEAFPINYRGRRIRKDDRDPGDTFKPREKCVDISLATSMLYLAAIPQAYELAIAVIGDEDFVPMLQCVRRLGKQIAIASIKGACATAFSDPRDEARVRDYDIIWLDDLLSELELRHERQQRECQASNHSGDRRVWTEFRPRKGGHFYCDACRAIFSQQKEEPAQVGERGRTVRLINREALCS